MTIFDKIRAALAKPSSSADLEQSLADARSAIEQAEVDLAAIASEEPSAVLDEKRWAAIEKRRSEAEGRKRLAENLAKAAETALEQARHTEREAAARELYGKAQAATKTGKAAISAIEKHATAILEELAKLAATEEAVNLANNHLPEGAEQLLPIELQVRGRPAFPQEILGSKVVKRWCFPASGHRLSEEDQARVMDQGNGTGVLPAVGHGSPNRVEQRTFRLTTFKRSTPPQWPDPLARFIEALREMAAPASHSTDTRSTEEVWEPLEAGVPASEAA